MRPRHCRGIGNRGGRGRTGKGRTREDKGEQGRTGENRGGQGRRGENRGEEGRTRENRESYHRAIDGLMNHSAQIKAFCDENGIPCTLINYPEGQHNFVVWKYGLYNFAQLIFK